MITGANGAIMTSAKFDYGIDHIRRVLKDLVEWMEVHEYESVVQMRGSMSQRSVTQPAAFERANHMKVLQSYEPMKV